MLNVAAMQAALLRAPLNRGMTLASWDPAAFNVRIATRALRVDNRHCQTLLKGLGPYVARRRRARARASTAQGYVYGWGGSGHCWASRGSR
jgi:hypothetical protein